MSDVLVGGWLLALFLLLELLLRDDGELADAADAVCMLWALLRVALVLLLRMLPLDAFRSSGWFTSFGGVPSRVCVGCWLDPSCDAVCLSCWLYCATVDAPCGGAG